MNKKKSEKEVLFSIYDKELYESQIFEDETPDFILRNLKNNQKIGVEITLLYGDQATAMLSNNPIFIEKFIDQNKGGFNSMKKMPTYLKKLRIAKIEDHSNIILNDHTVWHITTFEDFFLFFENIIKRKDSSYVKKIKDLQFVNLIAKDEKNFLLSAEAKLGNLYGLLRQHSLFKTIISSNFQEIFLISKFETGDYFIPLKWLIFRNEFEIFKKFWGSLNIIQHLKDNTKLLFENFCICLIFQDFRNIFLYCDNEFRYIIFGTHYWKINKKSNETFEHSVLSINLPEKNEMRMILKNHENYQVLYLKYLEFRSKLVPVFSDDMFMNVGKSE
jgi:hypothetical protein